MKTPDKLYIDEINEELSKSWFDEPYEKNDATTNIRCIEYLRKDILLEWAKDDCLKEKADKGDAWAIGYRCAMRDLIDKINLL